MIIRRSYTSIGLFLSYIARLLKHFFLPAKYYTQKYPVVQELWNVPLIIISPDSISLSHERHRHRHNVSTHLLALWMQHRWLWRLLMLQLLQSGFGVLVVQFLSFLHLFPFFSTPILEPYLHLTFRKPQVGGEFSFPPDGYVSTVVEFFFELHALMVCVDDSVFIFCSRFSCNNRRNWTSNRVVF